MNYIGLGELSAADSVGIESVTNDKPITFPFGSTTSYMDSNRYFRQYFTSHSSCYTC